MNFTNTDDVGRDTNWYSFGWMQEHVYYQMRLPVYKSIRTLIHREIYK
jgi:hypothetical protein